VIVHPEPPVKGVIFDFHATLVSSRDPGAWIGAAARHLGRAANGTTDPASTEFRRLSSYLDRLWDHARVIDPDNGRDLSSARHHDVFSRTLARHPGVDRELSDALYAVMTDQLVAFEDTLPVLAALRARGVRIVVLSNVGRDIRAGLQRVGLADAIDGLVLSYEVGVVKPQPEIFQIALDLLAVPAEQALMVGDSWQDDGAAAALGIRTLILPRTDGPVHGLGAVLRLLD